MGEVMDAALKKICGYLSAGMAILVVAVGAVMLFPRIMGNEVYAVLSGSMEPQYPVGSVVIVDTQVKPEQIRVGDPITFRKEEQAVATHRVVAIDPEAKEFRTKGDANASEDLTPVPYDHLIGKAGISVPLVGYIPLYMRTGKGMFCIGAYVIVFLLLQLIPVLIEPEKEEKKTHETHKIPG